ncbi:hypothetical protein NDN08_008041 [Rhodosorus marinus]|uniref:WD repeat-containing protein 75 second beta-propeller domain-containing protein n=1 Tax=Rhodosorus marinus TaxID=101924 RepID=A0AAV8UZ87_9RHOD|nr:hypothetical protein NDN08_008041 [Rhodosorus marinus]
MKDQWSTELYGGGSMSGRTASPVWSGNGRYVILPSGRSLKMYGFGQPDEAGNQISSLGRVKTLSEHIEGITAVADLGKFRCISTSTDGTARLWDLSDGSILRTIDVGYPIHAVAIQEGQRNRAYIAVGSELRRIEIMKGRTEASIGLNCNFIAAGPKSDTILGIRRRSVYVFSGNVAFENRSFVKFKHNRRITAVSLHPEDGSLAVGDEIGVITVYHNVVKLCGHVKGRKTLKGENVSQSKMHWHASSVLSLAYTNEGNILLSGGSEAVLVMWELSTGRKRFLPRIGGAILSISPRPSGTSYALTCGDNAVRFVSAASFSVVAQVRGIRPVDAFHQSSWSRSKLAKVCLLPDLKSPGVALVVGLPNVIQAYDMWRDEHLADIVISARNELFAFKDRATPSKGTTCKVQLACLSADGSFLVTLDVLRAKTSEDVEFVTETLRFNSIDPEGKFRVAAKVENPHGGAYTTSLVFHPRLNVVATSSSEGSINFWKLRKESDWYCSRSIGYRGFRCSSLCFSKDGSLLASACGPVLALWTLNEDGITDIDADPRILCHSPTNEYITSVSFTGSTESPLVITSSSRSVHVWNVITGSVWWSARMKVREFAADPLGENFAVIVNLSTSSESTPQCAVAIFEVSKPVPKRVFRFRHDVLAMSFVPVETGDQSALVLLAKDLEFIVLSENDSVRQTRARTESGNTADAEEELDQSEDAEMSDDDDHKKSREEDVDLNVALSASRRALSAFELPSHTLPSLTVTGPKFLMDMMTGSRDGDGDEDEAVPLREDLQQSESDDEKDEISGKNLRRSKQRQPFSEDLLKSFADAFATKQKS